MPEPPSWWTDFAAHLATQRHPLYAADTIAEAARLILSNTATSPASLLAHAREDSPQLVGALTDFFRAHGHLTSPPGLAEQRAAARRKRRIDAVPAPLRPDARAFADFLQIKREQARQLGVRPNELKTVEIRLDAVRDLAISLESQGLTSWASVSTAHVEAFLATNPARRASRLAGLRQFFAHAHHTKAVLIDPTAPVTAAQHRGFRGPTLTVPEQQSLYRRWTTSPETHPHESFIGLAALLHAATTTELRLLTDSGIDAARQAVRFPGRPVAIPLDPATWVALQRCHEHRDQLHSDNPHLLITRLTRTTRGPAGAAYIRDSLAPVGLLPRILRSTRLLALADELDIKMLTASLGMSYAGIAHYCPNTSPSGRT